MSSTQLDLIPFEQTPTSRKVTTIENKLTRELNQIVNKIRNNIDPLRTAHDIDERFRVIYGQQIYDLIRTAATDSYVAGIQYITTLPIFNNLQSYLLVEDINTIEKLTDEYTARFWGRVALTITKGQDKIFGTIPITREQGLAEPPKTFLSQKYIVESISVGVTNTALNIATITKMRHYADKANINPVAMNLPKATQSLVQAAVTTTEEELLKKSSGQTISTLTGLSVLAGLISATANVELVWFTSLNEAVCPICRPLHGKRWSIYDPGIQMPIVSSHPNCKCRLMVSTK